MQVNTLFNKQKGQQGKKQKQDTKRDTTGGNTVLVS